MNKILGISIICLIALAGFASAFVAYQNQKSTNFHLAIDNYFNNPTDSNFKKIIVASGDLIAENEKLMTENKKLQSQVQFYKNKKCSGNIKTVERIVEVEKIKEVKVNECDLTNDGFVDFADYLDFEANYETKKGLAYCFN